MSALPPIPPGPLNSVERPWDYKNGWVRAPIREIVTNKSLTKQARLLWLMLASLKEGSTDYTWGDIEAELGCQTKARKNCLAQLVAQGFNIHAQYLDEGWCYIGEYIDGASESWSAIEESPEYLREEFLVVLEEENE